MRYLLARSTAFSFVLAMAIVLTVGSTAAAGSWINDGSKGPPRLSVEQAIWAMGKLPRDGEAWSRAEQVAKIAEAGFDGFMVFQPGSEGDQDEWRELAAARGLKLTLQCAPASVADLDRAIATARRMKARGVSAMIRPMFTTAEDGAKKIRDMMAHCAEAKIPFYVETHRGTITQDLLLAARWAREIDGIQIHADLSHFVISYEIGGPARGTVGAAFDAILSRCGMADGRIGNGEQVQIDIGPKGESPHAARFAAWWKQAMVAWLKQAGPGDIFVFKSELGPPPYSIVGQDGRELSDRWAQALVVRDLGIRAWNDAVKEAGRGQSYGEKPVAAAAAAGGAAGGSGGKWPAELEPEESKIRTIRGPSHKLGEFYLAGQPAQPDFYTAQDEGVKTVINVRLEKELYGLGYDEDVAIEDIGLDYIHFPVGPDSFDDAAATKFLAMVREAKKPVLIHGSNGNRVWGLWALWMGMEHGVPLEATAAKAKTLGIKKLVVDKAVGEYLLRHASKP